MKNTKQLPFNSSLTSGMICISNKSKNRSKGRLTKLFIMVTTVYGYVTEIDDVKLKIIVIKKSAEFWLVLLVRF